MSAHRSKTKALILLMLSLVGLTLTYGTTVLLTRTLSADGYAVSVSLLYTTLAFVTYRNLTTH